MADKPIRVNMSNNFVESGIEDVPSYDFLKRADVYFDVRNNMVCYNCDFSTMQWYYNYLESNARFAQRNPAAYPSYLLDLGFVPIVFVPSCCTEHSVKMLNVLSQLNIPHIRTKAYSFTVARPNFDVIDAWMSKLDAEKLFGIPAREVTSAELARRLYGGR